MASEPKKTGNPPIGDPPQPRKPVKAEKPMEDPFTERAIRESLGRLALEERSSFPWRNSKCTPRPP